jgi:hypothetical protein
VRPRIIPLALPSLPGDTPTPRKGGVSSPEPYLPFWENILSRSGNRGERLYSSRMGKGLRATDFHEE